MFRYTNAVVPHAAPSQAAVVEEAMAGHRPAVWTFDRDSAQRRHGECPQTCMAHLVRDVAYALEADDDLLATSPA